MSVYHDFNSYSQALSNYINTPGRIIDGVGFVFSNGEWITDEEYNRHNSRPAFQYPNRQNSDGTNIASEIIIKKRK